MSHENQVYARRYVELDPLPPSDREYRRWCRLLRPWPESVHFDDVDPAEITPGDAAPWSRGFLPITHVSVSLEQYDCRDMDLL